MADNKVFLVKFIVKGGKMATKISSKNLSPQECVGMLEIAKQQLLDGLKTNKTEVFRGSKNE
jgi:hypothetical protein